jgi:GNAT superfamily N-acetyltransferase
MQFELSEALINDILFSMEDQNDEFYLDTQNGVVISEGEIEEAEAEANGEGGENRFIGLPEWDSSEGFRLMERFAAGFKNTVIRDKLTAALERGKGVFRAFKNVLTDHSEAEQLWFSFKEHEMRRVILEWYNALREEWGLERVGPEPEETVDLVLEDFRFRKGRPADAAAVGILHKFCLADLQLPPEIKGDSAFIDPLGEEADLLVAETNAGEFAGFISSRVRGELLVVSALEVRPEYRGLGLGEALLNRLLEKAGIIKGSPQELQGPSKTVSQVSMELPADAKGFSRVLLRSNFAPYAVKYSLTGN